MLYIWLAVIVALILVEILSRNFTAACFIVSAIISAICTLYNEEYVLEVTVFLVVGVLLLIFVRPNVMEYINNHFSKKEDKKDTKTKKEETEIKPEVKKTSQKKTKTKKSVKK